MSHIQNPRFSVQPPTTTKPVPARPADCTQQLLPAELHHRQYGFTHIQKWLSYITANTDSNTYSFCCLVGTF